MKNIGLFGLILFVLLLACKEKAVKDEIKPTIKQEKVSAQLEKVWETDTLLTTCESVIYDKERAIFYVACINGVSPWIHDGDGFIAKIDLEGNIIEREWVKGISAPKGMGIYGNDLYVTDINQVVKIDLGEGEIVERIPIEGGQNINDLTVAHDGDVFVSDSKTSAIYKITDGEVTKMIEHMMMGGVNGLFMEADTLYFACRKEGGVYRIQHDDLKPRLLANLEEGGDGVERYKDGFIISVWGGKIFHLDKDWKVREILNTKELGKNTADIEVVEEQNLLLVPTFFDNRVVAYRLKF
jgi:hypothetical protein